MQSELPKALATVKGKSMIKHLLEAVAESSVDPRPAIVVGYKKELVMEALGDAYDYAIQEVQLGTGHAVITAKDILEKNEHVMVLYGDNPFLSPLTIKKLAEKHLNSNSVITMGTVTLPDFLDWREFFYTNFSRIVRDANGKIIKSVEFRDASDEEKEIKEVNPCYFVFKTKWMLENLQKINNENAQKEYYLTDLVKIAMEENLEISSINIEPREALAANSKEELELLERIQTKG